MGTIIPEMGITSNAELADSAVAAALFTPVQQRVLGLLFGQPARRFQSAELIRLAAGGIGAVHRQLQRLADAGLVTVTRDGNQKYYQASMSTPIFCELHGLIVKTIGVVDPLRAALSPIAKKVHLAFVFGSVARGTERGDSDLDLLVVTDDLSYAEVYTALEPAEKILGRTINPTVFTRREWRTKRAKKDSFTARISSQPRLYVIRNDDAAG